MLQNLDRLKVFYHVFSGHSVMAAAKALHVSQSAVSQSLQKLESEIKSPLFTRLHKRLVPTSAGEHLFAIVQPFMLELASGLKSLDQARDQPFGELRIGAPVELGKAYLPGIAAAFREQYPDVTFYLEFGAAGTLLPMVEKGLIDFTLVDEFLARHQFVGNLDIYDFAPVVEEEVILACSRNYYEKSVREDPSFQNLARRHYITYRQDAQTIKSWFRHHFGKSSPSFNVVLTVGSHQAVISAIEHHVGLGVVASHAVKDQIRSGRIVPIRTSRPEIINQISRVYLQDKVPSLSEKVFEKFLVEKIQSMGIQGRIQPVE